MKFESSWSLRLLAIYPAIPSGIGYFLWHMMVKRAAFSAGNMHGLCTAGVIESVYLHAGTAPAFPSLYLISCSAIHWVHCPTL